MQQLTNTTKTEQQNKPKIIYMCTPHSTFEGYTHCLIRGPMSFPDTLEMDLRNPDVDTNIWLHMWDWYFWDEAVLARLKSLLNTWWEIWLTLGWDNSIWSDYN